jgi:hypothetical protein
MTAWRCFCVCRGSALRFFGGGGLARWRIAAIMAKASITRETWSSARLMRHSGAVVFSIGARERPAVATGPSAGERSAPRAFGKSRNSRASPAYIRSQLFHYRLHAGALGPSRDVPDSCWLGVPVHSPPSAIRCTRRLFKETFPSSSRVVLGLDPRMRSRSRPKGRNPAMGRASWNSGIHGSGRRARFL